ncbi:hypothetical protein HK101_008567 [Irineochytrium annulatum]|nr:hypothetical protein HK101_008567 [Irineochytrium annulatum]
MSHLQPGRARKFNKGLAVAQPTRSVRQPHAMTTTVDNPIAPTTATPPTFGGPPPAAASRPGQRGHFGIHALHHQLFPRQDKQDASLPPHARQIIIEGSPARLNVYEPEKVLVRTDQRYAAINTKQAAAEKARRRVEVFRGGFCSDAKEPYRTLGEPIIDSDVLVYTCLKIDPAALHRGTHNRVQEEDMTANEVKTGTRKYKLGNPPKDGNGFHSIKEKLAQSKRRLRAVKYGIPFTSLCKDRAKEDSASKAARAGPEVEKAIDWKNLKVDQDRQVYYQNLLIARGEHGGSRGTAVRGARRQTVADTRRTAEAASVAALAAAGDGTHTRLSSTSRESTDQRAADIPNPSTKPVTPKQIEARLEITPSNSQAETMNRYFSVRDQFYEQRRRLSQLLTEDLNRKDYDRKAEFVRKYQAFHVREDATFVDDITIMRQTAAVQRREERSRAVGQHPWYRDLVGKVHGANRKLSEMEQLILDRIRCIIEDSRPLTQASLAQIMRLIPPSEFLNDEIQRIIRLVRQAENISERDYLEAVEMAGHTIVSATWTE